MEEPKGDSLNLIRDVDFNKCDSNEDYSRKVPKQVQQSSSVTSFECNICFENAQEPVVTRCGHLYCWSCICLWLDRGYGDCPVCKAGVTQENVIPLYGRGSDNSDPRKKTKPRPKAERPEARQRETFNGSQGPFQSTEFTFGIPNISLITMFANPLGAILSLGIAQRFFYNEFQNNTHESPTNEEFRNQLISNISLLIGIIIMLYLLFLE